MRDVKFRAWDEKQKRMYLPEHMESDVFVSVFGKPVEPIEHGCDGVEMRESKHLVLMRYTGLKDKSGVDIYEGDIIKDEFGRKFNVYWVDNEARFTLRERNRKTEYFMLIRHLSVVVIGNIYEHPHLLDADMKAEG